MTENMSYHSFGFYTNNDHFFDFMGLGHPDYDNGKWDIVFQESLNLKNKRLCNGPKYIVYSRQDNT
jgi:hypothetical protein